MKSFKRLDYLTLGTLIAIIVTAHFTSVLLGHLLDVNSSIIYVLMMIPVLVLTLTGRIQRWIVGLDRHIEQHQSKKSR